MGKYFFYSLFLYSLSLVSASADVRDGYCYIRSEREGFSQVRQQNFIDNQLEELYHVRPITKSFAEECKWEFVDHQLLVKKFVEKSPKRKAYKPGEDHLYTRVEVTKDDGAFENLKRFHLTAGMGHTFYKCVLPKIEDAAFSEMEFDHLCHPRAFCKFSVIVNVMPLE